MTETAGGVFFSPTLDLYDSEGTFILTGTGISTAEIRDETLPHSGTYTVFAFDELLDRIGSYNISWHRTSVPAC